jgi:hypothetical protein
MSVSRPFLGSPDNIEVGGVIEMKSEKPSAFTLAMYALYERTKRETDYNETARRLIHAPRQSDGYTKLFMMKPSRLDLTVEAFVVERCAWRDLMGQETVERAMKRLRLCEYVPKPPT